MRVQPWLEESGLTLIRGWARAGVSPRTIAGRMGVGLRTLERWRRKYPALALALSGTKEVVDCCARMLAELPPIRAYEPEPEPLPDAEALSGREVTVTCHDGVFFVEGEWLLRLMQGINFDDYESLQYFQRVLQSAGVIDALVKAGVAEGDTVSLYDFEFDFVF